MLYHDGIEATRDNVEFGRLNLWAMGRIVNETAGSLELKGQQMG
jgi:hypothetical protein